MAVLVADRVKELTTTVGTGDYVLSGASIGFRSFSSVFANGDVVYYCAENGVDWEIGQGTLNPGVLSRTALIASSNSGLAVNWPTGSKNIFCDLPALALNKINSSITANSVDTLTNKTIDLTNNVLTGTKAQFDAALSDDNFAYAGVLASTSSGQGASTIGLNLTGKTIEAGVSQQVDGISALRLIAPVASREVFLKYYSSIGDGGEGNFRAATGASPGFYIDNGGTIIVPTGGDGSSAWIRDYKGGISVRWFGAKGDYNGITGTDDTISIQNAINYLTNGNGGRLIIPEGFYLVSSTLNVGLSIVTGYTFITTRASEMTDTLFNANNISGNITTNASKKHVEIIFESGATLVAGWTPAADTPVLAYNLDQGNAQSMGSIVNATIVSAIMIQSGAYNKNAVATPQSNNLIGIFAFRGCKIIQNTFISGIKHGVVSLQGYWTKITDVYVWMAGGRCLDVAEGNAIDVNNLAFWYSNYGLVFDGTASHVTQIHTEQVANEMTVFAADTTTFGPGYLEDVSATDGTGTNSITLGYNGNGTFKITSCIFNNLRVGSARPNKGGYRIWDVSGGVFNGCRAYSKTITTDIYSYITYNNCDFTPATPYSRTMALNSGQTIWANHSPPGSSYVVEGPWMFPLNSIATGSIAAGGSANYTYTLPTQMNSVTNGTATATYTSGGNVMLGVTTRLLFNTPRQVQITFSNPTAAAIDPGTFSMCLSVLAATP